MTPKKTARIAGLLYLLVIIFGIFAQMNVRDSLIIPGDAATTVSNIQASELLFRLGFVSDLVMIVCYLLLPLPLYLLLKPVNKNYATLMVVFVMIAVPVMAVNMLNQYDAMNLLSGADYLTAFTTEQIQAQVMLSMEAFSSGVLVAQIFFGAWLIPLGYLAYKSEYFPKVLGALLVIGGWGMMTDTFTSFLYPDYEGVLMMAIEIFGLSELIFCGWLLVKGVKTPRIGETP